MLLRDAIYTSLLRSKRRQIHAEIATALVNYFPTVAENQPEIVAYHYTEAAVMDRPCVIGIRPINERLNIPLMLKRSPDFRKALKVMDGLPDTLERSNEEIRIQLALGIPLIAVRGYAAQETYEAFERARTLCLKLDNPPEYFQALYGNWGHFWMSGKNHTALAIANEFL